MQGLFRLVMVRFC